MKISESLEGYIKKRISDCYKIINIINIDNTMYSVVYISYIQWDNSEPRFNYNSKDINLRVEMRDSKIEELLNSIKIEISDFDVEEFIYTPEQREKLQTLRNRKPVANKYSELLNVRKEYSDTFNIGQPVWYKRTPGIITFKHSDKSENDLSRFTVKIKETEYRYVDGTKLLPREIRDLSNIPIDKELDKLSTAKLLKIYKKRRDRNKGVGNLGIKKILQDREHIKIEKPKIIICN